MLDLHPASLADSFARFSAGSSIDARMAMIAITTRSSISVNGYGLRFKYEMDENIFEGITTFPSAILKLNCFLLNSGDPAGAAPGFAAEIF